MWAQMKEQCCSEKQGSRETHRNAAPVEPQGEEEEGAINFGLLFPPLSPSVSGYSSVVKTTRRNGWQLVGL
jgi:hypothetical protein